ncbi:MULTISPECIES: hypothetical protein [unclassified Pseudomonas]|uniref:hypothetical protein n=1 Tax=unclassified Pseudomonas TaxID=196821 RepID=UPI001867BC8F|nr:MULTISPECIES: hypothetical protein [unclassified Pseudomonas]
MDSLTRLLLRRYAPNDPRLTEPSGALAAIAKATSSLSNVPDIKVSPEALEKATGMKVVMSASDYNESVIFAAVTKFNRAFPELMARSYMLPVAQYGIPIGSWVFMISEEDD